MEYTYNAKALNNATVYPVKHTSRFQQQDRLKKIAVVM